MSVIFVIVIALFIAISFFQYFQKKKYERDRAHFERRRKQFENLLRTVKKQDSDKNDSASDGI